MRVPRRLDPFSVAALALGVRVAAAAAVPFPVPEDTAYYVGVARNLLAGRGLVTDAIWSYATPPLVLPRPAFELWRPLPSLLAAIPMALVGPDFRAAQVVPVVAGVAVALLAWGLGREVARDLGLPDGRARVVALGSGLASALALPLLLHSTLVDSTMLFAALTLGSCLVMGRLLGRRDLRGLVALGLLLGTAALVRSEALWLGLVWAALAARARGGGAALVRDLLVPAGTALAVLAPWLLRDLATFGTPLPSQALANAFFVRPTDVFAWSDPPTLGRLLATGPAALAGARVGGLRHDLVDVLLLPGLPGSVLGVVGLPGLLRRLGPASPLRPLAAFALLLFLLDSLIFPVATTQGTFLHGAGAVHVLLIVAAVVLLDRGSAALAARVGGPVRSGLGIGALILATALVAGTFAAFASTTRSIQARYERLGERLGAAGVTTGDGAPPIVSDHPIWIAETLGTSAIVLPDESAGSVLALARRFGALTVVVTLPPGGDRPRFLADDGPGSPCFTEIEIPGAARARDDDPAILHIACP